MDGAAGDGAADAVALLGLDQSEESAETREEDIIPLIVGDVDTDAADGAAAEIVGADGEAAAAALADAEALLAGTGGRGTNPDLDPTSSDKELPLPRGASTAGLEQNAVGARVGEADSEHGEAATDTRAAADGKSGVRGEGAGGRLDAGAAAAGSDARTAAAAARAGEAAGTGAAAAAARDGGADGAAGVTMGAGADAAADDAAGERAAADGRGGGGAAGQARPVGDAGAAEAAGDRAAAGGGAAAGAAGAVQGAAGGAAGDRGGGAQAGAVAGLESSGESLDEPEDLGVEEGYTRWLEQRHNAIALEDSTVDEVLA